MALQQVDDAEQHQQTIWKALDDFRIEIPSWGFANTGTRFGKFFQAAAATSIEEKFADAAEVNRLTGASPSLALHVLWDLPNGIEDVRRIKTLEQSTGIRAGSINPNLFQDQEYKFGSICNPSVEVRAKALSHLLASVEIGRALNTRDVSLWIADGSNYPGTQSMRRRIEWMEEVLAGTHDALGPEQRMLIEYKPFEPAFYHTDIADWGMALELARKGPDQKQRCSSIQDITFKERTSSRLSHGCCTLMRSAASTSTTGSTPMTISRSARSILTRYSASFMSF